MEETGIKFAGFYNYKKKIGGITRNMTRMVCFEDTLQEAEENIKARLLDKNSKKINMYHISEYDITNDISVKIKEYNFF